MTPRSRFAKFFARLPMAACLFSISICSQAEWKVFKPEFVQVLPNGGVVLWAANIYGFTGGCGVAEKPLRIEVGQYGVDATGVRSMLAVATAGALTDRSININYYSENLCRVDSITLSVKSISNTAFMASQAKIEITQ